MNEARYERVASVLMWILSGVLFWISILSAYLVLASNAVKLWVNAQSFWLFCVACFLGGVCWLKVNRDLLRYLTNVLAVKASPYGVMDKYGKTNVSTEDENFKSVSKKQALNFFGVFWFIFLSWVALRMMKVDFENEVRLINIEARIAALEKVKHE